APGWETSPAPAPRAAADTDGPCPPESAPAARSPPRSPGHKNSAAATAAASTSAPGSPPERRRRCRRWRSCHRREDLREERCAVRVDEVVWRKNPKPEIRNPNQIPNPKCQERNLQTKTFHHGGTEARRCFRRIAILLREHN